MVPITAEVTATDVCTPRPAVRLLSVVSSEPDDGRGDGHTSADIQNATVGTDDRAFQVRAERRGGGDGRRYTAVYVAEDIGANGHLPPRRSGTHCGTNERATPEQ